jgi:hypothetical protein
MTPLVVGELKNYAKENEVDAHIIACIFLAMYLLATDMLKAEDTSTD